MAKNNKLINSLAAIARRNRENNFADLSKIEVPQIYSAIALALWYSLDIKDEDERIAVIRSIFGDSQRILIQCVDEGLDVVQVCEDVTSICMRSEGEQEDET